MKIIKEATKESKPIKCKACKTIFTITNDEYKKAVAPRIRTHIQCPHCHEDVYVYSRCFRVTKKQMFRKVTKRRLAAVIRLYLELLDKGEAYIPHKNKDYLITAKVVADFEAQEDNK